MLRLPRRSVLVSILAAPMLVHSRSSLAALPPGKSDQRLAVNGTELFVFFYMPAGGAEKLLVTCHGSERHPSTQVDAALSLAEATRSLIVAPYFDTKRFPESAYQWGGLNRGVGHRTVDLIQPLVDQVRERAGAALPCYMIGHSAGGQFLQKVAAFASGDAREIVAANPGAQLMPSANEPYPYGYKTLRSRGGTEAGLQRYLAARLTLYQGTADTRQDEGFPRGEYAERQGASRYARGLNCFAAGKKFAEVKGWEFGWRLIEASGIGHSSKGMYTHHNAVNAVFGRGA